MNRVQLLPNEDFVRRQNSSHNISSNIVDFIFGRITIDHLKAVIRDDLNSFVDSYEKELIQDFLDLISRDESEWKRVAPGAAAGAGFGGHIIGALPQNGSSGGGSGLQGLYSSGGGGSGAQTVSASGSGGGSGAQTLSASGSGGGAAARPGWQRVGISSTPVGAQSSSVRAAQGRSSRGGGGGRPRKQIGGGREDKSKTFCDTMLSMLLLSAAESPDFDAKDILERSQKTLDIARCPLVLSVLERMIDNTLGVNESDEYEYIPLKQDEEAEGIIESFNNNFDGKHKEIFNHMAPEMMYYGNPPEEFEGVMGRNTYILNGKQSKSIKGMDEDPIELTEEELSKISDEKKGIPLGALLLLHALSVQENKYGLKAPEFIDGR